MLDFQPSCTDLSTTQHVYACLILPTTTECAGESLVIGGSVAGSRSSRRKSSPSVCSSSAGSSRTGKSGSSHSTFIESLPYIDGDGNTGHYTGHVDCQGQPNGRGKMKYTNGSKYDGVWHEGTKLHGKMSKKPSPRSKKTTHITPAPPPPPPPPLLPPKQLPGSRQPGVARSKQNSKQVDSSAREFKKEDSSSSSDLCSPRGPPSRGRVRCTNNDEEDNTVSHRRSLSRLRRKCDEIDSLLRTFSASASTKDEGNDKDYGLD